MLITKKMIFYYYNIYICCCYHNIINVEAFSFTAINKICSYTKFLILVSRNFIYCCKANSKHIYS